MDEAVGPLVPREPIAVVRLDDLSPSVGLASALYDGGIRAVEFTLTNRAAFTAIEQVRDAVPGLAVGAGTVLTTADARAGLAAGAQFLVTPTVEPDVIDAAGEAGVPAVAGAMTPTELLSAGRRGARLVKLFPAGRLGPGYVRDVLAPLPALRLVPTGGIGAGNAAEFLRAGAFTVAIGSNLVAPDVAARGAWQELRERAARCVAACQAGDVRR
ncbi:MAG: bifunctional 4-hydroxy-2-oxoglutarate aldolase/2-dehydro-3-deoxy-phosphogluconate aldolase [Carbonactinosporaceae bacterium]